METIRVGKVDILLVCKYYRPINKVYFKGKFSICSRTLKNCDESDIFGKK